MSIFLIRLRFDYQYAVETKQINKVAPDSRNALIKMRFITEKHFDFAVKGDVNKVITYLRMKILNKLKHILLTYLI